MVFAHGNHETPESIQVAKLAEATSKQILGHRKELAGLLKQYEEFCNPQKIESYEMELFGRKIAKNMIPVSSGPKNFWFER